MSADSDVLGISSNASCGEWIPVLRSYITVNDVPSSKASTDSSEEPVGQVTQSLLFILSQKLDLVLTDIDSRSLNNDELHVSFVFAICAVDTIRIVLRSRLSLKENLEINLIRILLKYSLLPFGSMKESAATGLSIACFRSLINLLFNNVNRILLFWSETGNTDDVVSILKSSATFDGGMDMLELQYYVIRLVYMTTAQSPDILSTVLVPTSGDAAKLVLAVSTCLHQLVINCLGGNCLELSGAYSADSASLSDNNRNKVHDKGVRLGPWGLTNGRLFVEAAKLLYALKVWDVVDYSSHKAQIISFAYVSALNVIISSNIGRGEENAEDEEWANLSADHALQLLMNAEVGEVLDALCNGCDFSATKSVDKDWIQHQVVEALVHQLNRQLVVAETIKRASEQAAVLTPILVILSKLCTASRSACIELKSYVFPNSWRPVPTNPPSPPFSPARSEPATVDGQGVAEIKVSGKSTVPAALMDPQDFEPGSLRARLLPFMTSLDSQLKRCAAELLFLLCDEDAEEFTVRTGFGNAVALLQLKGLL